MSDILLYILWKRWSKFYSRWKWLGFEVDHDWLTRNNSLWIKLKTNIWDRKNFFKKINANDLVKSYRGPISTPKGFIKPLWNERKRSKEKVKLNCYDLIISQYIGAPPSANGPWTRISTRCVVECESILWSTARVIKTFSYLIQNHCEISLVYSSKTDILSFSKKKKEKLFRDPSPALSLRSRQTSLLLVKPFKKRSNL